MYALVLNQKLDEYHYDLNHTYLGGVGLIGGAWGLAAAVYALLFGANTSRPWELYNHIAADFLNTKKLTTYFINYSIL
ncbi:uncharacterized protein OCT59_000509 [Rhizophagus irregularis]|uniref:uncharacterized protein n=1 Tax=Rhizophagus irregularis TaxID=588596 RepID=UPI00331DF05A|nr:hypothetical protein OCT59_000509 [Rhizophagus irregularis]